MFHVIFWVIGELQRVRSIALNRWNAEQKWIDAVVFSSTRLFELIIFSMMASRLSVLYDSRRVLWLFRSPRMINGFGIWLVSWVNSDSFSCWLFGLHIYRFVGHVILVTITSKLDEIVTSSLYLIRVATPPLARVKLRFLLKIL